MEIEAVRLTMRRGLITYAEAREGICKAEAHQWIGSK